MECRSKLGMFASLVLYSMLLSLAVGQDISGFYHTSQEIENEINSFKSTCPFLTTAKKTDGTRSLLTVTINKPSSTPKEHRILVFFGEHARELISPETGLQLIRRLCECSTPNPDPTLCPSGVRDNVNSLLSSAEFLITPNINQASRQLIESKGQYCLRANPNGVDLNRNWDDHWTPQSGSEYSGTGAFSELETTMLRQVATDYKPTIFLTIHSGCLAMWSPYSYAPVTPTGGGEQVVLSVLNSVNAAYCNCNVGNAGAGLGSISAGMAAGTCLDYMWDVLHTPYAMAFEIYSQGTSYYNSKGAGLSETNSGGGTNAALETHSTHNHNHHNHDHNHNQQHPSQSAHQQQQAHTHASISSSSSSSQSPVQAHSLLQSDSCFSSPPATYLSPHSHANAKTHNKNTLQPLPGWDVFLQQQQQQQIQHKQEDDEKLIGIIPHRREGPYDFDETLVSVREGVKSASSFPPPSNDELTGCLRLFNPTNADEYHGTINHWSETILLVFQQIIAKHAAI